MPTAWSAPGFETQRRAEKVPRLGNAPRLEPQARPQIISAHVWDPGDGWARRAVRSGARAANLRVPGGPALPRRIPDANPPRFHAGQSARGSGVRPASIGRSAARRLVVRASDPGRSGEDDPSGDDSLGRDAGPRTRPPPPRTQRSRSACNPPDGSQPPRPPPECGVMRPGPRRPVHPAIGLVAAPRPASVQASKPPAGPSRPASELPSEPVACDSLVGHFVRAWHDPRSAEATAAEIRNPTGAGPYRRGAVGLTSGNPLRSALTRNYGFEPGRCQPPGGETAGNSGPTGRTSDSFPAGDSGVMTAAHSKGLHSPDTIGSVGEAGLRACPRRPAADGPGPTGEGHDAGDGDPPRAARELESSIASQVASASRPMVRVALTGRPGGVPGRTGFPRDPDRPRETAGRWPPPRWASWPLGQPDALSMVLDPEARSELTGLARELGATYVGSGYVPPPFVAELLAR